MVENVIQAFQFNFANNFNSLIKDIVNIITNSHFWEQSTENVFHVNATLNAPVRKFIIRSFCHGFDFIRVLCHDFIFYFLSR